MYHQPVLLNESVSGLSIKPGGVYVDVTFGGGGHSRAILENLGNGQLIAFDQDEDAIRNTIDDKRFTLINHNFRYLKNFLTYHNALPVDGILADLGVSSFQFDTGGRGFSMRFPGEVDMRMNRRQRDSAQTLLSQYTQEDLKRVFREYGEIPNAAAVARTIATKREISPILTFDHLKDTIKHLFPRGKEIKYFARILQAIRIEINQEIDALKEFLEQSVGVLKSSGRLVVISYHSLEDRLVKNFMKSGNLEGVVEKDFYGKPNVPFQIITRKPIISSENEILQNNRARSARLRIAEKI
nr:16S rRNA (cytosine(1402)-N(4))-methyltransferase RsmH [Bacteroidota bacterium]